MTTVVAPVGNRSRKNSAWIRPRNVSKRKRPFLLALASHTLSLAHAQTHAHLPLDLPRALACAVNTRTCCPRVLCVQFLFFKLNECRLWLLCGLFALAELRAHSTRVPPHPPTGMWAATTTDPFKLAAAALSRQSVPDRIIGRDAQHAEILAFLRGHVQAKTPGSMYISGKPGTGKTASVKEIIKTLDDTYKKVRVRVCSVALCLAMSLCSITQLAMLDQSAWLVVSVCVQINGHFSVERAYRRACVRGTRKVRAASKLSTFDQLFVLYSGELLWHGCRGICTEPSQGSGGQLHDSAKPQSHLPAALLRAEHGQVGRREPHQRSQS